MARASFSSKFGLIAAAAGSAVGLGNIWRFPYLAGENGGAAFIVIYICVSFLVAVPVMITEFSIGRSARTNSKEAFALLAPHRGWGVVGLLGIITAITILSFYSVVAGWALEFLKESLLGNFINIQPEQVESSLTSFVNSGWRPILWTAAFIAATAFIVTRGIEKGIERYNKILMPLLGVILIILTINSFTLDNYREGFNFLTRPDFSKITGYSVLQALGQTFFSLSLGMGSMIIYGSYIRGSENIMRVAATVSITDVSVAFLSGLAIFPAVFSFGISPTSGSNLLFLTLPNVFGQMTGGYLIAIIFFFLVFLAAITSSVSMMEVFTAYLKEELHLRRSSATLLACSVVFILGSLCALSQIEGSVLTVNGVNLFDILNNWSSNVMLLLGGLLTVIFAGWVMNRSTYRNEVTSQGQFGTKIYPTIRFLIKFVAPITITILFLNQLGLL